MSNLDLSVFEMDGKQFQATRLGVHQLSKHLAKLYELTLEDMRSIVRVYDMYACGKMTLKKYIELVILYNFSRNLPYGFNLEKLIGNFLFEERLIGDYICYLDVCNRTKLYKSFMEQNYALSFKGRYIPLWNAFQLNGLWYPKEMKKALSKCKECGSLFFDQNKLDEIGYGDDLIKVPDNNLGVNNLCGYCDDYRRCGYCGRIEDEDNLYYVENDQDYVCGCCRDYGSFNYCDECGALINTDSSNDSIYTDDDRFFCCSDCAEEYGYHWSERYDCWTRDDDYEEDEHPYVKDYHSHSYIVQGTRPSNMKHDYLIGCELEVDGSDYRDKEDSFYEKLLSISKNRVFFETDGSLGLGFENITQPMYENDFKAFNWEEYLKTLQEESFRSHDTKTCGLHFHFSKWYLGTKDNDIRNNAKKVCAFFDKHWNDLVKFSRRENTHYCTDHAQITTKDTNYDDLAYDRYFAVNLTNLHKFNKGTIEIRLCRGTLNPKTFRASFDLMLTIVKNAKKISWDNIDNLAMWLNGIEDNTIEYIKSRNCFADLF